jgi:hypothetical protein
MKNKILIFAFLIITLNIFSQQGVTVSVSNLQYTNNSQPSINSPNCGNIDLGTSTSTAISIGINLTRPNGLVTGLSNVYFYTKKSSSDFKNERAIRQIVEQTWTTGTPNTNISSASFTINSSEFNDTGGTLYVVFKSSSGLEYNSCNYTITKTPVPTFTLSPPSLALSCGDVSQKTFSVSAQNIPAGVSPTYNWSYSNGWSGSDTNTSTINLTPSNPTSLPSSVSVTPFLNGVAQPTITCQVTRSGFDPNLSISGSNIGCPNSTSNYFIETFGNAVQWSVSNPSLATLNTTTGNNITLTPTGEGTLTLTATVFTACNQSKPFTKTITIGRPTITNYTIQNGYDNVSVGSSGVLLVDQAVAGITYNFSIIPQNSSCINSNGTTNPGSTLPYFSSTPYFNNGKVQNTVQWGNCPGSYIVRVTVSNGCANLSYYADKVVNVFAPSNNPCGRSIAIVKNPKNSSDEVIVNKDAGPIVVNPCDGFGNRLSEPIIVKVDIYNLNGRIVQTIKGNSDKVSLSNLSIEKGYYILHATLADGETFKQNYLKE